MEQLLEYSLTISIGSHPLIARSSSARYFSRSISTSEARLAYWPQSFHRSHQPRRKQALFAQAQVLHPTAQHR